MPTLTKVVEDNSSIREEDLTLLFTQRLNVQSQALFIQIGFILGIAGPTILQTIGLGMQPFSPSVAITVIVLLLFEAGLLLALYSLLKESPSSRQETLLKDYLKARQNIRDKPKTDGQPHPP